jgi:hypothetical protein
MRPVKRVQAGNESITLSGMLVQGLGRDSLNRGQRVLDAVSHLAHDQFLSVLCTFLLSNVPGNFGRTNDLALCILHRRHGQRDVDKASILSATDGVIVINSLTAADSPNNLGLFI